MQSKCVNCHVRGGASAHTRLVFVTDAAPDHLAKNLNAIKGLVDWINEDTGGGAKYILSMIRGGLGHGGGVQVAEGTDEYDNMERFLDVLEGTGSEPAE